MTGRGTNRSQYNEVDSGEQAFSTEQDVFGKAAMDEPVIVTRRVEFSDTDMAGIVHFAAYFRFMEAAEHEFLRRLGLSVVGHGGDEQISWPRVAAACEYAKPARFGDELQIEVHIDRIGSRSVTYRFIVRRENEQLAVGSMTSVCCRIVPGEAPRSIAIPPDLRELLTGAMTGS